MDKHILIVSMSQHLKPDESSTGFTLFMEREPGDCFKRAEPLVVRLASRSYDADLQNLKEMLEPQAVQVA